MPFGIIAADEKRHEQYVYIRIIEKLLEVDPNETMIAIADMIVKILLMPIQIYLSISLSFYKDMGFTQLIIMLLY